MTNERDRRENRTTLIVEKFVGMIEAEKGSGSEDCTDEKKCLFCEDERTSGKGCPFHALFRRARFFKQHEAAFLEGRRLYLKFSYRPDEQNLQELIYFLQRLAQAESGFAKIDLLFEFQEYIDELMRQEQGDETLKKQGREKGFTVMFEFFRENFYAFLALQQNPQGMLALFDDFIARRMVPAKAIHFSINPPEYNAGLNEVLSRGKKIFRTFVEQNVRQDEPSL